MFVQAAKRYLSLWWYGLSAHPGAGFSLGRISLMLLLLPLLGLLQLIHWLGFLCDEVLFRGYRKVRIEQPVFILGVPRSGTTHLHTVMAHDEQFTTFSLWECLFGLSITARYFWRGLGRIDRAVGGPLRALLDWAQRRLMRSLDNIHPITLGEPEEDYLALLPVFACFILVVPFPGAQWLWRMGYFDRDMSTHEQRQILEYYRRCLQRHLYFHGTEKTILSKNAAFASLAQALTDYFPDSRVICCDRDPTETLPSQLSALSGGLRLFGCDRAFFAQRFLELFEYYYAHLDAVIERLPFARVVRVPIETQHDALADTIKRIYSQLGLQLSDGFSEHLAGLAARSREFESAHAYSASDFGFSHAFLRKRFGDR